MTHMFWPAHESGHFWQPHLPHTSHSGPAYHICPLPAPVALSLAATLQKYSLYPLPLFPGFQHPSGPETTKIGGSSATIAKISAQGPHEAPCATGVPYRVILAQKFTPHRARIWLVFGVLAGTQNDPLRAPGQGSPPQNVQAHRMQPLCGCSAP